jgi:hypothetical protein
MIEIDASDLETMDLDGLQLPLANLNHLDLAPRQLQVQGKIFTYVQSYPLKGYSAVAPRDVQAILQRGGSVLFAERGPRLYLYQA